MFQTASDAVAREMLLQGAGDASVLYLVPGPDHTNKAVHNRRWLCRAVLNTALYQAWLPT